VLQLLRVWKSHYHSDITFVLISFMFWHKKLLLQYFPATMRFASMMDKMQTAYGFLAALDQSGGSTPAALELYGIPKNVRLFVSPTVMVLHATHRVRCRCVDLKS
jgi:hypothetical protein